MCGIIGVFPLKAYDNDVCVADRDAAARFLTTELIVSSEVRGGDATGIALVFTNGEWAILKQPVKSNEFTQNVGQEKYKAQEPTNNFKVFMQSWRKFAKEHGTPIVLGHVRKKTKGSEFEPMNNHPIVVNNIIGVHNGKVSNDQEIFEKHPEPKRQGDVDSEAIFHLHNCIAGDKPTTLDIMKDLDSKLQGEYTFLTVNTKFTNAVGAVRRERPLEIKLIEKLGLLLVASEEDFINNAIVRYNRMLLSMTGLRLPMIHAADAIRKTIPDREAVLFNLDGRGLDNIVSTQDVGFSTNKDTAYSSKNKVVKSNASGYVFGNSQSNNITHDYTKPSTYNTGMYTQPQSTTPPVIKIVDYTRYTVAPADVKDTDNDESCSAGLVCNTLVCNTDPTDNIQDVDYTIVPEENIYNQDLLDKGLEKLTDVLKDQLDDSLMVKKLSIDTVTGVLGVNDNITDEDKNDLLDLVAVTYKHAFPEGYVRGYQEGSKNLLDSKLPNDKHTAKGGDKKSAAVIASLKSFISSLLALGDYVGHDAKTNRLLIENEPLELAKKLNPKFKDEHIFNLYKTQSDIDIVKDLLNYVDELETVCEEDVENETSTYED